MEALLQPWAAAVGAAPGSLQVARGVLERYAELHRHYHDGTHLREVLDALRVLTGPSPPAAVVCAAYWHDAVYDPRADDNEQRSADLAAAALAGLGLPAPFVAEVVRLVLLTVAHDPAGDDADGALLSDADLAVLAAAPVRYAQYAAGVRREYGHVDDAAFLVGRRAVLRGLLDRPSLYATEQARQRWEAPARANLARELTRLAAPTRVGVPADGAVPPP